MKNVKYYWNTVITKEFLEREYIEKLKSVCKIARELGCDPSTVSRSLTRNGIVKRKSEIFRGEKSSKWVGYGEIPGSYWCNIKGNAKTRKIAFEVTLEDVWGIYLKQDRKCALTGREIGFESYKSNSASLDRINSNLSYSLNNLQWVHKDVNHAKGILSNEAFISLCKEIATNFK